MVYMFIEKFTNPKYISLVAVLFLVIIAIGCESSINGIDETNDKHAVGNVINQIPSVKMGDTIFEVELAINPAERAKGLSGRNILDKNNGMLFVFNEDSAQEFWMYGMKFPLDIVWISSSCKIIDITYNAEHPENPNSSEGLVLYSSKLPATYALEINAGEVDLYNINIGGLVEFLNFPKGNHVNC